MEVVSDSVFSFLLNQRITGWLSILLISIVTYYIINFIVERKSLPPGPFPLPIFGNLLSFNRNLSALKVIENFYKQFGDVFTLWLGNKPHIVVTSYDHMKEILINRKDDFNGRPDSKVSDNILQGGKDIVFSDISHSQTTLKKMGYTAVRKYIISPNFVEVVYDNAMDLALSMLSKKEAFDPEEPLYDMLCTMMEVIIFGDCEKSKKNVDKFADAVKLFDEPVGNGIPSDYIPLLTPFYWGTERTIRTTISACLDHVKRKVEEHKAAFKKDDIKDFVDAILASKTEAEESDKHLLADENIHQVILNLFLASVSTTYQTLSWLLLEFANNPELQNRVYNEIKDSIGDRMAVPKDKDICPYTSAAFSEVLRLRCLVPMLFPHKTTKNTSIGDHKIPKDTAVLINVAYIQLNDKVWEEPDIFKPERFLDKDGKYTSERLTHYAPFGLGKRSCPGEKMAKADIFMILVTLLQKWEINLESGPGTADFTPKDSLILSFTKPYKILVKPRK